MIPSFGTAILLGRSGHLGVGDYVELLPVPAK
jgi:hypothetical protein